MLPTLTTCLTRTLAALAIACVATSAGAATDLATAVRAAPKDTWLTYHVPAIATHAEPCCFEWQGGKAVTRTGGCRLDNGSWGFGNRDEQPASGTLAVYLHVGANGVDRVRSYGASCPVDPRGAIVTTIDGIAAADSVRFLDGLARAKGDKRHDAAVASIALHADPSADRALIALTDAGVANEVRRDAAFWLGQSRGEPGFAAVRALYDRDPDVGLRKHLVFVLSQSDAKARNDVLTRIARDDRNADLRGEALFWMVQADVPGAEDAARRASRDDASAHVRKHAIFVLSQLEAPRNIAVLKSILEDASYPKPARREAMFWLAQADDDEALAVFDDILR